MKKFFSTRNILSLQNGWKQQNVDAAFQINQKAKTIHKNKKLEVDAKSSKDWLSKRRNVLTSRFPDQTFSLFVMGKKNDLRRNLRERKIGLKKYGETDNLMNFKPSGGKIFVWMV